MIDINGKIAAILGNNAVVINKGKIDGVSIGMIFAVKLNLPEIVDPDDNSNVLSSLYYTKGKIKIESVYDRMAFGAIQPKRVATAYPVFPLPQWEQTEFPAIAGKPLITEEDWKIKVGDEVVSLPVEKEAKK